jgi:RNA polymerase sigma factor (sigma-70 family)
MQPWKQQVHAYAMERAREAILEWVAANPGRLSIEAALDYTARIAFAGSNRFDNWIAGQLPNATGSWRHIVDEGVRVKAGQLLRDASSGEGGSEASPPNPPRRPDVGGGFGLFFADEAIVDAAIRFAHTIARRYLALYGLSRSYGNSYDLEDLCQTAIMRGLERFTRRWNPARGRWQTYLFECILSAVRNELRRHAAQNGRATESAFFDRAPKNFEEAEEFKLLFLAVDSWAKLSLSPAMLHAYSGRMAGDAPGRAAERVAFSQACHAIRAEFGPLDEAVAS